MIRSICLENFLAFQSKTIEMAPLSVLSGTNSSGKSSILHAFALLRQSADANTQDFDWMLNGNFVELGTGRDVFHAEPTKLTQFSEDYAMSIGITLDSDDEYQWGARYVNEADVLHSLAAPSGAPISIFAPGFQYLKADRIVPSVTFPKSHEHVMVSKSLGARGEHTPNYLRKHGDFTAPCRSACHPSSQSGSLLDQTNAWINELSPGTELSIKDVPDTDFVRIAFTRLGAQVHAPSQRATNVGFGLTYALPIIVSCLIASEGSLLLIENPEAHLHPAGQALVGRLCAMAMKGGAQVIVETHSDHVLNAIRLSVKKKEIESTDVVAHFFSRQSGGLEPDIESIRFNQDGSLPKWPLGFFDQWDRDLEELLG